jgi:carbon-monoxide dehydrogenase iron sulfur subunit
MGKTLVFKAGRCTGCRLCEQICSIVHTNTCDPERSRIRIVRMEEKGVNLPTYCHRCEEAACMAACPTSAISRNKSTDATEIDHELCVKCEACVTECPFRGIYFDRTDDKIIACDFCGGDPQCVTFCETRAIEFLDKGAVGLEKEGDAVKEFEALLKLGGE